MTPQERTDLVRLMWFWEGTYDIGLIDDVWTARPIGSPADLIQAESAAELREALRTDYASRQVGDDEYAQRLGERMST